MSEKNIDVTNGNGPFSKLLPEFISYQRAQGYKVCRPTIYLLRVMDRFFKERGVESVTITRNMYDEWTSVRATEKPRTTAGRRSIIKSFAKYLLMIGYDDIYTGGDDNRKFKGNFVSYIYTDDEIKRIFKEISSLCKNEPVYENDAFRIMILMYYCCGLRRNDVLNLLVKNLDTETGKITILNGKNEVDRIVVASDTLLEQLQIYQKAHLRNSSPEDYFLHGIKTKSYSPTILYKKFHWILNKADIPKRAGGRWPRIHDLRHTFCVKTLVAMQEKGFDLYTSLPLLTAYLGHKSITDTEYYLKMTEEYFINVLEKTDTYNSQLHDVYERRSKDER